MGLRSRLAKVTRGARACLQDSGKAIRLPPTPSLGGRSHGATPPPPPTPGGLETGTVMGVQGRGAHQEVGWRLGRCEELSITVAAHS